MDDSLEYTLSIHYDPDEKYYPMGDPSSPLSKDSTTALNFLTRVVYDSLEKCY